MSPSSGIHAACSCDTTGLPLAVARSRHAPMKSYRQILSRLSPTSRNTYYVY